MNTICKIFFQLFLEFRIYWLLTITDINSANINITTYNFSLLVTIFYATFPKKLCDAFCIFRPGGILRDAWWAEILNAIEYLVN